MVERGAHAAYDLTHEWHAGENEGDSGPWCEEDENTRESWRKLVRTILEAVHG